MKKCCLKDIWDKATRKKKGVLKKPIEKTWEGIKSVLCWAYRSTHNFAICMSCALVAWVVVLLFTKLNITGVNVLYWILLIVVLALCFYAISFLVVGFKRTIHKFRFYDDLDFSDIDDLKAKQLLGKKGEEHYYSDLIQAINMFYQPSGKAKQKNIVSLFARLGWLEEQEQATKGTVSVIVTLAISIFISALLDVTPFKGVDSIRATLLDFTILIVAAVYAVGCIAWFARSYTIVGKHIDFINRYEKELLNEILHTIEKGITKPEIPAENVDEQDTITAYTDT